MIKKTISTILLEYDSIKELDKIDQQLIEECKKITRNAYAPYSNFHVGAALLLESGERDGSQRNQNRQAHAHHCAFQSHAPLLPRELPRSLRFR